MPKKRKPRTPVAVQAHSTAAEQSTSPTWRQRLLLDERYSALWSAAAVFVAIAALLASYVIPWSIQSHVEESSVAKITYAVSIMPNPPPGERSSTTTYWGNTILIWNSGPATAKTMVLHIHAPSRDEFLHSALKIVSAPAAADVQINERSPSGIYEVVIRNFSPGDYCGVRMAYRAEGALASQVRQDWNEGGLFSAKFARHFIKQFWFTGENLRVENIGALDVKQTFVAK